MATAPIVVHHTPPAWLTTLDTVVKDAVSVESMIAGIIAAFFPILAPFVPEVNALLNVAVSALDKAVAQQTS